jgi:hypothetical protein
MTVDYHSFLDLPLPSYVSLFDYFFSHRFIFILIYTRVYFLIIEYSMGKKYITLCSKGTRYRLYSDDIKNVFQKTIRKVPTPPSFPYLHPHPNSEDITHYR